jgi:hypothetical protein
MSSKKIENLMLFKIVWDQLLNAEYPNIRDLAIKRYIDTRSSRTSAVDAWQYGIECVVNRLVEEEKERLQLEQKSQEASQSQDDTSDQIETT